MPIRITTYQDALDFIGAKPNDKIKQILLRLSGEGRSEKSIAYSIWREHETIMKFRGDSRFYSVLENSIRKWSWARDDPRWNEYKAKKQEEEKAREFQQEQIKYRAMKVEVKFTGPGFIYFIQGASGGAIKIGYTTNVAQRLKELQTGFPDTLVILCAKKGWPREEAQYHKAFVEHRLKGEWFKPCQDIFDVIKKIKDKKDKLAENVEKYKKLQESKAD